MKLFLFCLTFLASSYAHFASLSLGESQNITAYGNSTDSPHGFQFNCPLMQFNEYILVTVSALEPIESPDDYYFYVTSDWKISAQGAYLTQSKSNAAIQLMNTRYNETIYIVFGNQTYLHKGFNVSVLASVQGTNSTTTGASTSGNMTTSGTTGTGNTTSTTGSSTTGGSTTGRASTTGSTGNGTATTGGTTSGSTTTGMTSTSSGTTHPHIHHHHWSERAIQAVIVSVTMVSIVILGGVAFCFCLIRKAARRTDYQPIPME